MQKHHPDEELEIGFTQQTPQQPVSPIRTRQRFANSPEAATALEQHSPNSPHLPHAESSDSPSQPRQRQHVLRSSSSRLQPHAEANSELGRLQHRHGSRLALSLGDLDIPQLLAERDLHEDLHPGSSGPEFLPHPIKQEPNSQDLERVLGSSLMLNSMSAATHQPQGKPMDNDVHMQTSECQQGADHDAGTAVARSMHGGAQYFSCSNPDRMQSSHDTAVSHLEPESALPNGHVQPSGLKICLSSAHSHSPERLTHSFGVPGRGPSGPCSNTHTLQQPFSHQTVGGLPNISQRHGHATLQQLRVPPVQTGYPLQTGQSCAQGLSASLSPHALQVFMITDINTYLTHHTDPGTVSDTVVKT